MTNPLIISYTTTLPVNDTTKSTTKPKLLRMRSIIDTSLIYIVLMKSTSDFGLYWEDIKLNFPCDLKSCKLIELQGNTYSGPGIGTIRC